MKKKILVLITVFACSGLAAAQEPLPELRIGTLTDGPYSREGGFLTAFRTEVESVLGARFAVRFPGDAQLNGGWSSSGVAESMAALMADPGVDLVVAIGPSSAAHLCSTGEFSKPAFAVMPFSEAGADCTSASRLRVSTIDLGELLLKDLRAFQRLVDFSHLVVLTDQALMESVPAGTLETLAAAEGFSLSFLALDPAGLEPGRDLPPGTDAVYLMPLLQIDDEAFSSLVKKLREAHLPTFSLIGEAEVERGVLAGLNTPSSAVSLARSAAVDVLDLLENVVEERPSFALANTRLTINMATARSIGVELGWAVLSEARLLHKEPRQAGRPLNLEQAVRRAVAANLDLLVQEHIVAAGREDLREAQSLYRPQLELAVTGVAIDEGHAIPAMGNYARFASGSLILNQLIYSDDASAGINVQEQLVAAREYDREALRLDIALTTVGAYMDLLRTQALVEIRQSDVSLNRTNLDLARLRRSVGSAGAAEVHRWEAALATARATFLEANAARRQAERQLSRLLDEDLSTRWRAQSPDLEESLRVIGGEQYATLLDTPTGVDALAGILLPEGLAAAPELAALDSLISGQTRVHEAARRASYSPTVALQGGIDHIFAKDDEAGFDLGAAGVAFPAIDDTSWNVAVQASLPLLTGGRNKAERQRSAEELQRLRLDRDRISELLEQRLLSALDAAAASRPAVALRREAATAASRSSALVRDAYGRGAASILDLLDAQNATLSAELAAVTAVYDFLDDWAEVQRSAAAGPGTSREQDS